MRIIEEQREYRTELRFLRLMRIIEEQREYRTDEQGISNDEVL
jgi:hypothetical protein